MTAANDRLLELLTDRALTGLSSREQIELAELLVHAQHVDMAAFDNAAAAIALTSVGPLDKLPASLADKIELAALGALDTSARPASDFMATRDLDKLAPPLIATQVDPAAPPVPVEVEPAVAVDFKRTQAMDHRPGSVPVRAAMSSTHPIPFQAPARVSAPAPSGQAFGPVSTSPPSNVVPLQPASARANAPSRAFAIGGWVAAAACLVLAIGALLRRPPPAPVVTLPVVPSTSTPATSVAPPLPTPTAVASMTPAELREKLLASEGSARAEWTPTKDPLGKSATGEVVWNKEQQKGTMRFKGLAKNDPTRAQYQLWIFDKTRDEKYPVDGGVFDVDSETGDVIVPIRATLPVNTPVLFAVTLEKPGGVVVSKREHIVVTAKMTAG